MKKAVIYARTSTLKQGSIPTQIEDCEKYANSRGWDIVKVVKDEGISGCSIQGRPGFLSIYNEMVNKTNQFNILLSRDSSRISRDEENAKEIWDVCKDAGVKIHIVEEYQEHVFITKLVNHVHSSTKCTNCGATSGFVLRDK